MARDEIMKTSSRPVGKPPISISLDRTSFVPFYRQIADQVREMAQAGEIAPGQPFWSEGEISAALSISKMTVRQAYQLLRAEGLLSVAKGKRPLAASGRLQKNTQELRGFTEEMMRRGLTPSSKLLHIKCGAPEPEAAAALNLEPGAEAFKIRRLRLANRQPIGVETSYLPARLFRGIDLQDLEHRSLYSILETHFGVSLDSSEEEFQARPAAAKEAELLHIKPGAPLFCMTRKVFSVEGVPIEYCVSLFRGDRYSATVVSHRKPQ